MKPFGRVGVQFQECPARLISSIFIRRATLLHHCNSGARRELLHCRWKISMLVVHDEPKNAPARATTEAVKGLPARADHERRRFLLMKWTKRFEICSGAFERKIRADYVYDIVRGSNLLDHFRRDRSHARLVIFASFGF